MHKWSLPGVDRTEVWIKRDDASGCVESGNKVRKLEFLLAEAKARGCDCVVTVGAIQSNHCRATAAACRRVGLVPYLILRYDDDQAEEQRPSWRGNLLIDRVLGAHVRLISASSYHKRGGGLPFVNDLCDTLRSQGKRPYGITTGGSNALGTFGYIEAYEEILSQSAEPFDAIFVAIGSGGTAAGLALANAFGPNRNVTDIVAFGVCDTPEWFYDYINKKIFDPLCGKNVVEAREIMTVLDASGKGYGKSTDEELEFIIKTAQATGIVLDPSYSAKAAYAMTRYLQKSSYRRVLFVHTGGMLGLYKKKTLDGLDRVIHQKSELSGSWKELSS